MSDAEFTPTTAQSAALKKLEAAFSACRKSGLAFYGVDNELYAVAARGTEGRTIETFQNTSELERVNTSRAYRDSGAW